MGGSIDDEQRAPLDVVADVVIEVPLVGSGFEPESDPEPSSSGPNWRRSVGIALGGGLVAGIALSVVLLNDDDVVADPADITVAPDELSTQITTPPTLAPLAELPTPDDPALAVIEEGPQPATSQQWSLFEPDVQPPRYPPVPMTTDSPETELDLFDLDDAVARLADDVPRRSTTHLELGTGGFVLDVTITRDLERDRYQIVLESRGDSQVAIVDVGLGTTFLDVGADGHREVLNTEIIAGSDAATINEYFDRLLLGPLRPDTIDAAEVEPAGLVTIDGVGVARRFDATVDGSLIPEWQLFAFSPVFEFPVEDRPSALDYRVYVDQQGNVAQVDGVAMVGNVPQLVEHRIELLDPPSDVMLEKIDGELTAPSTISP